MSASTVVTSNYNGYEVSCDGFSDGNITLTFNGDLAVDTYQWNDGVGLISSDPNLLGVGAGTYSVTVFDINGCFISTPYDTLESPNAFTAGILNNNNQIICYNTTPNTLTNVLPTGGQLPYTYNWEYLDTNSGLWEPVTNSSSSSNTYLPNPLVNSTDYRVIYESSLNCGQFVSNIISINVLAEVNPGIIVGDQTLCYDTIGNPLTFATNNNPNGGGGIYDYVWQKQNNLGGWDPVGTLNFYPISSLATSPGTHEYRLRVTSVNDNNCIDRYTNTVTIEVYEEFTAQITTLDQDICYNTLPDNQLEVLASGADNNFTYQWYIDEGNGLNLLSGAESDSYLPSVPLTILTAYNVEVTSVFGCGTIYPSIDVNINVADTFMGDLNSLNPVLDTICYFTIPDLIETISSPSGGYPNYSYEWFSSNDGFSWDPATNSITDSYQADELIEDTYFKVTYTSGPNSSGNSCGSYTSDSILIVVLDEVDPGVILEDDTICNGANAQVLFFDTNNLPSGGNESFDYHWQVWNGNGWNYITGAIDTTFDPGSLTSSQSYRLGVTSTHANNCIERFTDSIYIHVWEPLNAGVLSQPDVICYNTSFADIINTSSTGVDNNFTYNWYADTGSGFYLLTNNDNMLEGFDLADTSDFYLEIFSTLWPQCDTLSTNIITVPVYGEFIIGDLTGGTIICNGETPTNPLIHSGASGANGDYDWKWELHNGNGWDSIPTISEDEYSIPGPLYTTTHYQLTISNTLCGDSETTDTVTVVVNERPSYYAIEGPAGLSSCANQQNVEYTLATIPSNYSYSWDINPSSAGSFVSNTYLSDTCHINWSNSPGTTANLSVEITIDETGCDTIYDVEISLSDDVAPTEYTINLKPGSNNILISPDSTTGITYQWGTTEIASGTESIFVGETLQYIQLSTSAPQTNIYYYWVETELNGCITRSYYNSPPLPMNVNDVSIDDFVVYPNPMDNYINFNYNTNGNVELMVVDMLGQQITCDIDYHNRIIRFSDLNPGIYMLVVKSNKNEFIKKFIKQ